MAVVSIVIPTRNRAHTLAEAIGSVMEQTYTFWECLVVDDHSSDATADIVQRLVRRDPRINYLTLTKEAKGGNAARNLGMERAQGDFVLFLDSDDALAPHCLEQRIHEMNTHPEIDFGVFPTLLFRETPGDCNFLWNIETDEDDLDRFLSLDIPWQTAGAFWRRSALKKIGPWKNNLPDWQDWEYHLRALIHNLAYKRLGVPDSYWRTPQADSVWNQSNHPQRMKFRMVLLDGMVKSLRRTGRLGDKQKNLLGGLYFWHARFWYSRDKDRGQACAAWWHAWNSGAVTTRRFFEGLRWFFGSTRGHSLDLRVVFPHWPSEYLVGTSSTFQKMTYPQSEIEIKIEPCA